MNKKQPMVMKDAMTPSPHTVGEDQSVEFAKKFMAELGVRHLPVLKAGRCVGILSDRDVKLAFAVDGKKAGEWKVREISSPEVYEVSPTEPLARVASHMAEASIGSAVVMENSKVVGIFTTTDACRWLGRLAG